MYVNVNKTKNKHLHHKFGERAHKGIEMLQCCNYVHYEAHFRTQV